MSRHGFGVVCKGAALWAVLLSMPPPAASQAQVAQTPSQIVIRLKPRSSADRSTASASASATGLTNADIDRIHKRFGITHVSRLLPSEALHNAPHPLADIWVVGVPNGVDSDQLLRQYRSLPDVLYAEVDRPLSLFAPDDSLFDMQWGLRNIGQAHLAVLPVQGSANDQQTYVAGLSGADIHADSAVSSTPSGSVAVVAIIDTGVDPNHPELADRIWTNVRETPGNHVDDDHNGYVDDLHGWDMSGDIFLIPPIGDGDSSPLDYHGHGTHCAGIVAARSNNGRGVAGIADRCSIMPVKIFPLALTSVAARAVVYAADNGADVVNMSWGSPWRTQVLEDAINYALQSGVVLCAASGNDFSSAPAFPAGYPGVIAVGATDDHDRVTPFSNYGDHLCLVAPGLDILSLRASGTDMYAPTETDVHKVGTGYYLASGTSMAAPFVTGAIARLRGLSPGLVSARVRELLETTATDLVDPMGDGSHLPGRDARSGAGRLNLDSLLKMAPIESAQITWPRPFETVTGTVPITGTAWSERGLGYVLEFGKGSSPTSWIEIASGSAARRSESLAAWNVADLEGLYTLRLRVGDSNAACVRVYAISRRRAEITLPADGDTVTSWTNVVGSALDSDFRVYLLELSQGEEGTSWTQIKQGSQPATDEILTSWSAGQLPDGWYRFRLRLLTTQSEAAADTVRFYLRSAFSTTRAWKAPLNTAGPALVASYGDLDTDGTHEIVVATSDGIRAFHPDGQIDAATQSRLARTGSCSLPLAIGDTDGDGKDDLVAVNDSGVIWMFPSSERARRIATLDRPLLGNVNGIEEFIMPVLFLKDIDGDNRDEIHYFPGYSTNELHSYHVYWSNGHPPLEILHHRFAEWNEFEEYFPADLNGDGKDELYVAQDQVYRLDAAGALTGSAPLVDSAGVKAAAKMCSAVDIDGDGRLELVIMATTASTPSNYVLYVFEENLTQKPGWPRNTGIDYYWVPSDVVFCDLDGDGFLEYFISWFDTELGRVSAWHADGTPLSGHESYSVWASSVDPAKFRTPVATDLNADGQADLIACATEDIYLTYPVERLIAWDPLGRLLPGWPVIVESGTELSGSSRRQTTAVGDVDQDGTTDMMMVTSDNNLVFINVSGATYDSTAPRVEFWRYHRSLDNTLAVVNQLRVESVSPTQLQPDVPAHPLVMLGFNQALDLAQDFSSLLEVSGTTSGVHSGAISYDPARKRISFRPDGDFLVGEQVEVKLSKLAQPESGLPLPQDFVTAFTVEAGVPLAIEPSPGPGELDVPKGSPISFQLTTDVDPQSLSDSGVYVTGSVHGRYWGTLQYDVQDRRATFITSESFAPAEVVTAIVLPGITSLMGIVNDSSLIWSFTIAWPQVLSTTPSAYALGAPRSTRVSATLDGPLPPFALDDSSVCVYASSCGRVPGDAIFVPSTKTLRFSPDAPFRMGDQVTAVVPRLHRVWQFAINSLGGSPQFAPAQTFATGLSPRQIAVGDIDGDGALDLVASGWPSPFAYLLRNSAGGRFRLDSVLTGGTVGQVLLADLDGDGDLDLITVDQLGYSLGLLYNLGAGRFSAPSALAAPNIFECVTADINGDGHPDLLSSTMVAPSIALWLNSGDGRFSSLPSQSTAAVMTSAVPLDFNLDGRVDLAVGDLLGHVSLLRGDGAGGFAQSASWITGVRIKQIVAADCDRNGYPDLLVLHTGGKLEAWRHVSDETYLLDTIYALTPGAERVQTTDFNADGRLDLAVAGGADRKVHLFTGLPNGRFAPTLEPAFADTVWSVVVADLEGDGDLDLATGGEHSLGVAYFGSGSAVGDDHSPVVPGQFELSQNYPNPFNPSTALDVAVPTAALVKLEVFNLLGQRVALLTNDVLAPGYHHLTWDGRSDAGAAMPSGVYFYRLRADDVVLTRRMLLLR